MIAPKFQSEKRSVVLRIVRNRILTLESEMEGETFLTVAGLEMLDDAEVGVMSVFIVN